MTKKLKAQRHEDHVAEVALTKRSTLKNKDSPIAALNPLAWQSKN